jgi:hypothetical protein
MVSEKEEWCRTTNFVVGETRMCQRGKNDVEGTGMMSEEEEWDGGIAVVTEREEWFWARGSGVGRTGMMAEKGNCLCGRNRGSAGERGIVPEKW